MENREFDVIVWGATGFTGRLVAEYLLRQYGPPGEGSRSNLRWALAGRSEEKLKALLADLGPGGAQIPLVLADSDDRALLDVMAARARVICSAVGPYALYGSKLVAACVHRAPTTVISPVKCSGCAR